MTERYSRLPMRKIWTDEYKFKAYLKVEILAVQAFSKLGVIPKEDALKIKNNASFDLNRIREIEAVTKHDVVAFTRAVSETLNEERKWIHYGLTSTDVVDTAQGYLLKEANQLIEEDLQVLLTVLKKQAIRFKSVPCIGRTHGIHADITSFGLKWALWYEQTKRNLERFQKARKDVETGKISGAVGNFANIPPFIQDEVCKELGLESAAISTQILQRDRHAYYMATLSVIGSTLEQMATEIRHLQRTEVHEAEEAFTTGQKGSSAMPHKRNPIGSENICGCARILRGYMISAYEDIALWHERDISHSSAERIYLPDATMLLDYMLHRLTSILDQLVVYPEVMLENIYKTNGVIFAQRVMNALIDKGLSREEAYDLVQPLAMTAYNLKKDYFELLAKNKDIGMYLNNDELKECFTLEYYMKNVDLIYRRCNIE